MPPEITAAFVINRLLDWALTGENAFSNGDALAVLQIGILLYAFRDRIFARVTIDKLHASSQKLGADVEELRSEVRQLRAVVEGFLAAILKRTPDVAPKDRPDDSSRILT